MCNYFILTIKYYVFEEINHGWIDRHLELREKRTTCVFIFNHCIVQERNCSLVTIDLKHRNNNIELEVMNGNTLYEPKTT